MITYQVEILNYDLIAEVTPILIEHYHEIAHYKDIKLDVDWDRYLMIQDKGLLRIITARDDEQLIGYVSWYLAWNPHYSQSLQASQDVLYLHPDHRKGRTGIRLIKFCEDVLRNEGVQVIYQHAKIDHPVLGKLLTLMGYKPVDTIYARRLDNGS